MGVVFSLVLAVVAITGVLALALGSSADDARDAPANAAGAAEGGKPHAVLLVLDEFPTDSLLGRDGSIDSVRYPNLAALARDSTWFRNAASSYDSTTKAVPLILDGMRPRPKTSSDRSGHPRSLFDMFEREGYRLVASEEATALCPPSMCEGGLKRRPAIIPRLLGGRPERYRRWLASIRDGERPTFWMKHLLLPHGPYLFLPSGARSRPRPRDLLPGMNTTPGFHDEFLTRHNEQRYLLQLGYADRLIGRLLKRLKGEGIYDETLIVVTADHGIAWEPGVDTRRRLDASNVHELAPVPFFVKGPGQRRGAVSDSYVRTLDVPSTIADVLGLRLGYRDHGTSAFGAAAKRRRRIAVPTRDFASVVRISGRRWRALRRAVARRRLRDFGSGELGSLFTGIGPNRGLIGSMVGKPADEGSGSAIAQDELFLDVRRASGVAPTQVAGDLGPGRSERELAVALNGRIEAVGRSFRLKGDPTQHFAFNVPESALREGRNSVVVYEVVGGERLRPLAGR